MRASYTLNQSQPDIMHPTFIRIPLAQLIATDTPPLTRTSIIELARNCVPETAREVHITVIVEEEDGLDIELATIELNTTSVGDWRLQYVSHPTQSFGLTTSIKPIASDFAAYLQMHDANEQSAVLHLISAQELEDEGLGPLASLNLRYGNSAPVVPTYADIRQFPALMRANPRN